MKSYTINFNGTGEVSEGMFRSDIDAEQWAEAVLEARGFDVDELVTCDWEAYGAKDDGEQCYRMLYWASEADAHNDSGATVICELCRVGENCSSAALWWHCGAPHQSADDRGKLTTSVLDDTTIEEAEQKAIDSAPEDGRPYHIEVWITRAEDSLSPRLYENIVRVE